MSLPGPRMDLPMSGEAIFFGVHSKFSYIFQRLELNFVYLALNLLLHVWVGCVAMP